LEQLYSFAITAVSLQFYAGISECKALFGAAAFGHPFQTVFGQHVCIDIRQKKRAPGTAHHPRQPGLSTYICHNEKYIEVLTYVPVAHSKFYRPFRVGAEACRDVASLPLKAHRLLGENNMIIHTSSRVQLGEALKRAEEEERAVVYSCS